MQALDCNFCKTPLVHMFADLGKVPAVNAYVDPKDSNKMEPFYPLAAYVCESCYLVQVPEVLTPDELFSDYAYFSSYSDSWLSHSAKYVDHMLAEYGVDSESQVIEIASNDGYLLQYFKKKGVPVLGIEPAENVAKSAMDAGIPTLSKFFGVQTAKDLVAEGMQADLLLGNNVLAHVPDLNDFVGGIKILLKPGGVNTMEFPHLMRLIQENQFDTIYHEHFSYLSFTTVVKIFAAHELCVFEVKELPTHGGSLRIYARHVEDTSRPVTENVRELIEREELAGITQMDHYLRFAESIKEAKRAALEYLIEVKRAGKRVVGYGAPAKGTVFLNYSGIRNDFIDYTVDRSPHKQGYLMPGIQVPIFPPEKVDETKPDYLLILPWNLRDEIMEQMAHIRDWDGKFLTLIPEVQVHT